MRGLLEPSASRDEPTANQVATFHDFDLLTEVAKLGLFIFRWSSQLPDKPLEKAGQLIGVAYGKQNWIDVDYLAIGEQTHSSVCLSYGYPQ